MRFGRFALPLAGLVVLCAAIGIREGCAQSWPQRTVKLIVPLSPGTGTDVTARLYADRLSQRWGQPVVVENRPGADALVAVSAFVGARDEHTLLFSFGGPVTINPILMDKLPYDPERDLVPIVSASDSFLAVAVANYLDINSLDELAKRARAEPGKLTWAATAGLPRFAFAGFVTSAGLDMVEVPYRDFNPALQDVSEGRISVAVSGLLPLMPLREGGKARIIAVTNRTRSPAAPDIPTGAEAGYPAITAEGFQGFFGWRDMPQHLRDRIAADVRAVAPSIPAERLASMGQVVRVGSTADFIAMIEDQRAQTRKVIAEAGMKR
jgi:tripartite-type tricarboxylate transporter receptor subunit TctC